MKNHHCPLWTPLYWHRRLLEQYVFARAKDFVIELRRRFETDAPKILDIGCGSRPYESAFGGSQYSGADVGESEYIVDILIDPGTQKVAAGDATYHGVVSFQVMEHVPDYMAFLKECWRILAPGGLLLLTVPFAFEFHGVPSDYRRWSHEGLEFDLEKAGFVDISVDPVESDFCSVLSISELYLASRFGYIGTKPLFLLLNAFAFLVPQSRKGLIPLTNGVLCQKPWRKANA